jgi:hypothetical protein
MFPIVHFQAKDLIKEVPAVLRVYRRSLNECVIRGILPSRFGNRKSTEILSMNMRTERHRMSGLIGAHVKPGIAGFDDGNDGNFATLARICDFLFAGMDPMEYFMYRRGSSVEQKMRDIERARAKGGLEEFLDSHLGPSDVQE